MKYWTQIAKELNPISTWGCYYISLVNLASLITGKEFTAKQIIESWNKDYNEKDTDIESSCLNPVGILKEYGVTATFLGPQDKFYQCKENEYEILEYFNIKTLIVHFVLGDGKGNVLFDPYPNSNTVKNGVLRSKRIFKI